MVLRSLESGLIASKYLVVDFDTAKVDGNRQIDEYFEERVKRKLLIESNRINDIPLKIPLTKLLRKTRQRIPMPWKKRQ